VTFTHRRLGSVVVAAVDVVIIVVIVVVVVVVDVVAILMVIVMVMAQQVGGVGVAVEFGGRRQRDVRLKTPAELFGLRVRYDFLRVHQPRRSLPLDQTAVWHIKTN